MQLCLKHAVLESDKVNKTVKRVANLVGKVAKSTLQSDKLEAGGQKKLMKHCETRWNSNCKSLQSVMCTDWKKVDTVGISVPSTIEMALIREFVNLTKPFEEAFQLLQKEETSAIAHVLVLVYGLMRSVQSCMSRKQPEDPMYQFLRNLENQLKNRLLPL